MTLHNLLIKKKIPKEVINYIYHFDDQYKLQYNKLTKELRFLLDEYTQRFNYHRLIYFNSMSGDESYNPNLEESIRWVNKFGLNYNPSIYILKSKKN